jgi:hypothetical protein
MNESGRATRQTWRSSYGRLIAQIGIPRRIAQLDSINPQDAAKQGAAQGQTSCGLTVRMGNRAVLALGAMLSSVGLRVAGALLIRHSIIRRTSQDSRYGKQPVPARNKLGRVAPAWAELN